MSPTMLERLTELLADREREETSDDRKQFYQLLQEKAADELNRPTHIAVIGKTGVGKTSTINALFGTDWKVSHVSAATQGQQVYLYDGKRGKLKISDLPGLGEDIETEARHRELYLTVLEECEVALLVLKADSRDMLEVQRILSDVVVSAMPDLHNRIVIGLNQIDLVQPGFWIETANVPSMEQLDSINEIVRARTKSIQKVCPIKNSQVVAYSAKKRYHLVHLFLAMMAHTSGEAWVLDAKKNIADWKKTVDPELLPTNLRDESDA